MADIAALIAPRPLIIEAGERDHIFPIAATREAFAQLGPVWETLAAHPPEPVVTPGGHAFRAERSLEALREHVVGDAASSERQARGCAPQGGGRVPSWPTVNRV